MSTLIQKKRGHATKGFIADYSDLVIDMVNDLYHNHGVRPSSRTILYRLKKLGTVTKDDVKKVEALVAYLKLNGDIQVHKMIDAKRSMYGTSTYSSKESALDNLGKNFKLDLWNDQENEVLIMCEAVGYTDVISKVAREFRCDYIGSGGDFSVHWKIKLSQSKYTHIIYVGDMDAKGIEIPKILIRDINDMQEPGEETTLVRVAHDVTKYDVELENVDVEHVRDLIRTEVTALIDQHQWDESMMNEEKQRKEITAKQCLS